MTALAAVLAGSCVSLLMAAPPRLGRRGARPAAADDISVLRRLRPLVAVACAVGGWALVGGAVGLLAGAVAASWSWHVLGRAEGPAAARRREHLARDLPTGVDLLAACVQAGGAIEAGLVTVADALGGPVAEELRGVHHRLSLGLDPVAAWRGLEDSELRPLVRAVLRAHESGAPVSEAVSRLADDLREQSRSQVLVRANSVEVKAAGPLAACFLPAFVLLAVVPLVVATVADLDLFW